MIPHRNVAKCTNKLLIFVTTHAFENHHEVEIAATGTANYLYTSTTGNIQSHYFLMAITTAAPANPNVLP